MSILINIFTLRLFIIWTSLRAVSAITLLPLLFFPGKYKEVTIYLEII
jgi:hypothetical protein